MKAEEFRQVIAEELAQRGFAPELAAFVTTVAELRARKLLVDYLARLRETVDGVALLRASEPPGRHSEPLRAAARRLHVAPSTLLEKERKLRKALNPRTPVIESRA